MSSNPVSSFIFLDPSGRRWPTWKRRALVAVCLLALAVVLFIRAIMITPRLQVPEEVERMKARIRSTSSPTTLREIQPVKPLWLNFQRKNLNVSPKRPATSSASAGIQPLSVRLGFVAPWDPSSLESFKEHSQNLTHVCMECLNLKDLDGNLELDSPEQIQEWIHDRKVHLLLSLQNLNGSEWRPERVESLASGPQERRNRFFTAILNAVETTDADGIVIDWQDVDNAYKDGLTLLLSQLAQALHGQGRELWVCVPVGNEMATFDLEALSEHVDRFVAVLHDENSERDEPGPIASEDWFEGWLKTVCSYGRPEQWIITVGNYGYDWEEGKAEAQTLSFADIMARAAHAGISDITEDSSIYNPHFHYETGARKHSVWFLDAITALNQLHAAAEFEVGGFAVFRLGLEDPDFWTSLDACTRPKLSALESEELSSIQLSGLVGHVGSGELISVEKNTHAGHRKLSGTARGLFTANYTDLPMSWTVFHEGAADPDKVTLTFDDGPDPDWTPRILDILKKENVKAVFFIVGRQAELNPGLVRRIVDEGHEIGSHTFFHPDLSQVHTEQVKLELNSTQRLLQAITGRSTILFRPPYIADSKPAKVSELRPLLEAQNLGYIILAQEIDPRDYEKPGTHEIVRRIMDDRYKGNVILLHDGGGNRRQSVEALPQIIHYLQERGDKIVSASELLGIPRDEIMPPAMSANASFDQMASGWGFFSLHFIEECVWALMIFGTVLVLIRTGAVALLATRQVMGQEEQLNAITYHPPVSVVIAAFNESKVISKTIHSILENKYPGALEVVVVDDGSTDDTFDLIRTTYGSHASVRLIRQENTGKAGALTRGIRESVHDILVFVDADTQFTTNAILFLVQPLKDPRTGAVSGQARVGNTRHWLGKFQWLEYICGFNLDRRAYALLNAITVVPGAIGAYSRPALDKVGGFNHDTLAEDTDLTLALHRAGYLVAYAGNAIAQTEAPETFRALFKQRFRWAFGTMQCVWKHRDMIFNPQYRWLGFFSLPNIWLFQIGIVALMPLADLLAVSAIMQGATPVVWIYIGVFMLTDLILAALACSFENTPLYKSLLILPMRLLYRPLLSLVIWKSLLTALRGALVGWGKTERTASPMQNL